VNKKPIIGGIILVAIVGVVFAGAQINPDNPEKPESVNVVFHVTLADPSKYTWGEEFSRELERWQNVRAYRDHFYINLPGWAGDAFSKEGMYMFRFVANGDSPEVLTVSMKSCDLGVYAVPFEETFTLKGIPHESETSLYYTWDYDGQKKFLIQNHDMGERGCFRIVINPNGNFDGPVSVDLIKLRGLEGAERILG